MSLLNLKKYYYSFLSVFLLASCTYTASSSASFEKKNKVEFEFTSLDNDCCDVTTASSYDSESKECYSYQVDELTFPSYSPQNERVISASISRKSSFENLKKINLPDSIVNISNGSFKWLGQLQSINIPASVSRIEEEAFKDDESLLEMKLPNVKTIGISAFENCKSLQSVDFGSSVLEISDNAFAECLNLKSVTFSPTLKKIEMRAFSGDSSLESLTIPGSVKEICSYAFVNCTSLKSVIFEDGVTSIQGCAFDYTSIKKVFLPKSITTFEENAIRPSNGNVTIYCEAKEKPDGFYDDYSKGSNVSFVYGVTREEFNQLL